MLTVEQIKEHRIEPEQGFLERFPAAAEAAVYEFETEAEAQDARSLLMAAAFGAGHGRTISVPWQGKQRLLAFIN